MLQITHFQVSSSKIPKSFDGYKILQLTDLHGKQFGVGNSELLEKINEIKPELIVFTGDMINSNNDFEQVFLALGAELALKYPVYCISGNHEDRMAINKSKNKKFNRLKKALAEKGVHYIDNQKVELKKSGAVINLYGLNCPLRYYAADFRRRKNKTQPLHPNNITKLIGEANKSKYNLMLMHIPFYFEGYAAWGADLTLCGHIHGGLIRLPFFGGLLSPDITFFPKYDAGRFDKDGRTMIVGRGLGGSGRLKIRVNNPPEIVVVTLKQEENKVADRINRR